MSQQDPVAYATKFLEDLLSFFSFNADITATVDGDVIHLDVPTSDLNGFLIGSQAETLRALQNVVSSALRSQGFGETRINIDVAGYKKQQADRLTKKAYVWIDQVKATGEDMALVPMNAADRRTVHQAASEKGITTESVGEGRARHIVLKPSA